MLNQLELRTVVDAEKLWGCILDNLENGSSRTAQDIAYNQMNCLNAYLQSCPRDINGRHMDRRIAALSQNLDDYMLQPDVQFQAAKRHIQPLYSFTPFTSLIPGNPSDVGIYQELAPDYPIKGEVLGDGDCYYRAALFNILVEAATCPDQIKRTAIFEKIKSVFLDTARQHPDDDNIQRACTQVFDAIGSGEYEWRSEQDVRRVFNTLSDQDVQRQRQLITDTLAAAQNKNRQYEILVSYSNRGWDVEKEDIITHATIIAQTYIVEKTSAILSTLAVSPDTQEYRAFLNKELADAQKELRLLFAKNSPKPSGREVDAIIEAQAQFMIAATEERFLVDFHTTRFRREAYHFDNALMIATRCAAADTYLANQDTDYNGMTLRAADLESDAYQDYAVNCLIAGKDPVLADYVRQHIMSREINAEGPLIDLGLVPALFGFESQIIRLTKGKPANAMQSITVPDAFGTVCYHYRGQHYDAFLSREATLRSYPELSEGIKALPRHRHSIVGLKIPERPAVVPAHTPSLVDSRRPQASVTSQPTSHSTAASSKMTSSTSLSEHKHADESSSVGGSVRDYKQRYAKGKGLSVAVQVADYFYNETKQHLNSNFATFSGLMKKDIKKFKKEQRIEAYQEYMAHLKPLINRASKAENHPMLAHLCRLEEQLYIEKNVYQYLKTDILRAHNAGEMRAVIDSFIDAIDSYADEFDPADRTRYFDHVDKQISALINEIIVSAEKTEPVDTKNRSQRLADLLDMMQGLTNYYQMKLIDSSPSSIRQRR